MKNKEGKGWQEMTNVMLRTSVFFRPCSYNLYQMWILSVKNIASLIQVLAKRQANFSPYSARPPNALSSPGIGSGALTHWQSASLMSGTESIVHTPPWAGKIPVLKAIRAYERCMQGLQSSQFSWIQWPVSKVLIGDCIGIEKIQE